MCQNGFWVPKAHGTVGDSRCGHWLGRAAISLVLNRHFTEQSRAGRGYSGKKGFIRLALSPIQCTTFNQGPYSSVHIPCVVHYTPVWCIVHHTGNRVPFRIHPLFGDREDALVMGIAYEITTRKYLRNQNYEPQSILHVLCMMNGNNTQRETCKKKKTKKPKDVRSCFDSSRINTTLFSFPPPSRLHFFYRTLIYPDR